MKIKSPIDSYRPRVASALMGLAAISLSLPAHALDIVKTNNLDNLDQTTSWIGEVVPTSSDVAVWNSQSTATNLPVLLGTDLSFGGLFVSAGVPSTPIIGAGNVLTLGTNGISLNGGNGPSNRGITLSNRVDLAGDQTWLTGYGSSASANLITAAGIITGTGTLRIDGTAPSTNNSPGYVRFNTTNTFTGPLIVGPTGGVYLAASTATNTAFVPLATPIGMGDLIIEGGTIAGNGPTLMMAHGKTIYVSNDFAVNQVTSNLSTMGSAGRVDFRGVWELGSVTRTISIGRSVSALQAVGSSFTGVRFGDGNSNTVQNGQLRFIADPDASAANWAGVTFSGGNYFNNGSGVVIGNRVITAFGGSNPFVSIGAQPTVTVESNGVLNVSDGNAARSPQIRSLSGHGLVVNLYSNLVPNTLGTLIIEGSTNIITAEFAGAVQDREPSILPLASNGLLAVTKRGANSTQIFSGTNTYTGKTSIESGILHFKKRFSLNNADLASLTTNRIQVNSGATLELSVGGTDEFTADDIATILGLGANATGIRGGARIGLNTDNASGGEFIYPYVFSNAAYTGGTSAVTVVKYGTNVLHLSGSNTFSGGFRVQEGTLRFSQRGGWGSGASFIAAGATAVLDMSSMTNSISFGSALTGSGTFTVRGPGFAEPGGNTVLTMSSGTLSGFNGTVVVASTSTNSGRVDLSGTLAAGLTFRISNSATLRPPITTTLSGVNFEVEGAGTSFNSALRLQDTILDASCTVTLIGTNATIGTTTTGAVLCAIGDGGNGFALTKSAGGLLRSEGANTYTGPTFINGGICEVNGNSPLATGLVTVANGSTLNGVGSIGGGVTVNGGGTINASTNGGIGTFTAGKALTISGNGIFGWDSDGVNSDLVSAQSASIPGPWTLNVNAPGLTNGTYTLVTTVSGVTLGAQPTINGATGAVSVVGNTLVLNVGAVASTPFEDWQTLYFGSTSNPNAAFNVDADGDGAVNLIEYGFNTIPNNPNSKPQTTVGTSANRLTIDVPRNSNATDITYHVEESTNLLNWLTVTNLTATSPGPAGSTVTVSGTNAISTNPRDNLRVRITLP